MVAVAISRPCRARWHGGCRGAHGVADVLRLPVACCQDPSSWLVCLSAAMFVGGFFPGMIPLWCSLSPNRLKTVTVFGAGMLIGTALIVVVPEGIHLWYSAAAAAHSHDGESHTASLHGAGSVAGDHGHDHDDDEHGNHWQIGIALAAGFVFMIIVDRMGGGHGHGHGGGAADRKEIEKPEEVLPLKDPMAVAAATDSKSMSVTLGLLIHAAVDGVALGSASLTQNGSLSMLVFFAIILHKGPAAFGLASHLLHQGVPRDKGAYW